MQPASPASPISSRHRSTRTVLRVLPVLLVALALALTSLSPVGAVRAEADPRGGRAASTDGASVGDHGSGAPITGAAGPLDVTGSNDGPLASVWTGAVDDTDGATGAGQVVTLVTGDRVRLTSGADGARRVVADRPGTADPQYWLRERGDDVFVVPADVAGLVGDELDPTLFNVTELLDQGHGDGTPLPLIADFADDGVRTLAAGSLPGSTGVRTLESINGVAVTTDPDASSALRDALVGLARSDGEATTMQSGPLAGLERLWLDRRVEASLSDSVSQVGVPTARDLDLDGDGVRVAILDSGIDQDHPDLQGRVVASRNFTFDQDVGDGHGHGTHVASIVASGHAELGGVAPGVELASGKVLDGGGNGLLSWVIDGMEWAAGPADADIVNLSLGAPADSFGAGPVADALDRLSAETDVLFVAAAGNDGCDRCVGSPGVAESALTVGAVDDHDQLAPFSSRGPAGDGRMVKPELTAPGVGIVAARAAGTSLGDPVDATHTSLSGTSMAAPHVAGAAALLAQAHPDWDGEQLEAALVSTTTPTDDIDVFAGGAGRLDVGGAVTAPVVATRDAVGFGQFRYPHVDREPVTETVGYRNLTDQPVTLQLTIDTTGPDGEPAPEGTVTVDPSTLIVPANGTASAELSLDSARGDWGLFGGALRATADGRTLTTPISYHLEEEKYDVQVEGIARDGRPAFGGFNVLDVADGTRLNADRWFHGGDGPCTSEASGTAPCVRLAPGTYSVIGTILTMPDHLPSDAYNRTARNVSMVGDPELAIDGPATVTLDAREARRVTIDTPDHPDARANLGGAFELVTHRAPDSGPGFTDLLVTSAGNQLEEAFFLQPSEQVDHGRLTVSTQWHLEAPSLDLRPVDGPPLDIEPYYYDPVWHSDNSWQYPRFEGSRDLRVVDAGTATAAEVDGLDLSGSIALAERSDAISVVDQAANAQAAGAELLVVANDRVGHDADPGETNVRMPLPAVRISGADGQQLRSRLDDRPLVVSATGVVASPYRYDLALVEDGRIRQDPHHVVETDELARLDMHFTGQLDTDLSYSMTSFPLLPWQDVSMGVMEPVADTPRVRRDFVSTDHGLVWAHGITTPEPRYNFIWPGEPRAEVRLSGARTRYEPGTVEEVSWLEQPMTSRPDPDLPPVRSQDLMRLSLAGFVDAQGHHGDAYTSQFDHGFSTDLRLYEDGELLARTDYLPPLPFEVSDQPARYRIVQEVDNAAPWARLSTHSSTTWEFDSRAPADPAALQPLPLLTADWDLPLTLRNRYDKPRGRRAGPHRIAVEVGHPDGVEPLPIRAVELEVSWDDGASWKTLRSMRTGPGRYQAIVRGGPRRDGFVSLRLAAEDTAGNQVRQEVIRAYRID